MKRWKLLKHWLVEKKIYYLIGLTGVNENEPKLARGWSRFFSYTVVLIAIALLLQWQMDLLGQLNPRNQLIINWFVWLYFVFQYALLLSLVKVKVRYIKENWLLPIVIIGGIPFIFQIQPLVTLEAILRPFLAIVVLIPSIRVLALFFIDGKLRTTLLAAFIIIVIFGVIVAGVDPRIRTAWDGIWWAIATVSTVGYGDVVPSSPLGRLIGMGLIFLGLGVFVVITANFLALTLRKEVKGFTEEEKQVEQITRDMKLLRDNQIEIISLLQVLASKMKKLEERQRRGE